MTAIEPIQNRVESLADLQYQITLFLRATDQAAQDMGLQRRQAQLILSLKGLPEGKRANIRELAERLRVHHHRAIGLVNCLVAKGVLVRCRDGRQVLLRLTSSGEAMVRHLAQSNLSELRKAAPLAKVLRQISGTVRQPGNKLAD